MRSYEELKLPTYFTQKLVLRKLLMMMVTIYVALIV